MVFYECVITAKHNTSFQALTELVKSVSMNIVTEYGVVRGIHNHGIRSLPVRFRSRFPDRTGQRYYEKGRFISIYYDSNPRTMNDVQTTLTKNEEVLRHTHLKARSNLDEVNRQFHKNYMIRKVMRQKELKEKQQQQEIEEQEDKEHHDNNKDEEK